MLAKCRGISRPRERKEGQGQGLDSFTHFLLLSNCALPLTILLLTFLPCSMIYWRSPWSPWSRSSSPAPKGRHPRRQTSNQTYIYIDIYMYQHLSLSIYMYIYIYIYTNHIYIYIYMYRCVYIYIYIYL